MELLDELNTHFYRLFGRETAVIARAPGQINLLGAHLQDSEGVALSATIDLAVWVAAAPTDNNLVTIHALNFEEKGQFQLPSLDVHASSVVGTWLNYPVAVAWALQSAGHTLTGMDVLLISDLPMGVGLGSSSAVAMAFVLVWEALSDFSLSPLEKALIGQRAENDYLGANSRVAEPYISLLGESNHIVSLDYRTLAHSLLPLPADGETAVILADSGVRRPINHHLAQECQSATVILQAYLPHIKTLRDVSLDDLELYGHHLPVPLYRRALHVVGECARVQTGILALNAGNLASFGRLIRQSHISSRDHYGSSLPELDSLAASAWAVSGCIGARFAGNSGGVVQVLVEKTAVSATKAAMLAAFKKEYGRVPHLLETAVGAGALLK